MRHGLGALSSRVLSNPQSIMGDGRLVARRQSKAV